jgi:hypothetical protein
LAEATPTATQVDIGISMAFMLSKATQKFFVVLVFVLKKFYLSKFSAFFPLRTMLSMRTFPGASGLSVAPKR